MTVARLFVPAPPPATRDLEQAAREARRWWAAVATCLERATLGEVWPGRSPTEITAAVAEAGYQLTTIEVESRHDDDGSSGTRAARFPADATDAEISALFDLGGTPLPATGGDCSGRWFSYPAEVERTLDAVIVSQRFACDA